MITTVSTTQDGSHAKALRLDLGELRNVTAAVLTIADELSAHARTLRLRLYPATDVVSLAHCARVKS